MDITTLVRRFYPKKVSQTHFLMLCSIMFFAAIYCAYAASLLSYFVEHNRYYNLLGIVTLLLVCVALSHDRSKINLRLVATALLLHIAIALIVLKTSAGQAAVAAVANLFAKLYDAAGDGVNFLFGQLGQAQAPWGFIFAIKVLPIIIFFGAFMSLLFYFGIVQRIVLLINMLLQPLLGTSGAETLCAIANSFLGQTEAPLLIRHYLRTMTKSEFMVVMISGMGTISGAILAVFAAMGVPAKHLLASSVMSIPATILIAKILYPETETPRTLTAAQVDSGKNSGNVLDAISQGTSDGLQLALNVGAMLIAFIALIGMINGLLSFSCVQCNSLFDYLKLGITLPLITLQHIFSLMCMPFAWLLGFTGTEAHNVSELLGTKVAINELVAYSKMMQMNLTERTSSIVTYALCGFSNFSCIGIQIGGIGALVPEKREWLSELGLYAVMGGALANLLSAMVAGLLL